MPACSLATAAVSSQPGPASHATWQAPSETGNAGEPPSAPVPTVV